MPVHRVERNESSVTLCNPPYDRETDAGVSGFRTFESHNPTLDVRLGETRAAVRHRNHDSTALPIGTNRERAAPLHRLDCVVDQAADGENQLTLGELMERDAFDLLFQLDGRMRTQLFECALHARSDLRRLRSTTRREREASF